MGMPSVRKQEQIQQIARAIARAAEADRRLRLAAAERLGVGATDFDALFAQCHALAQMNDQSLSFAKLADDSVAGNRPAAARVLDRDAFDAAQRQRAGLGR